MHIAAIIPTLIASTGFLLGWRLIPGLYILVLSYFIVSPYGEIIWQTGSSDVYGSAFRFLDILLSAAVLISIVSMVRYMSMTTMAIPSDISKSLVRKSQVKRTRPDVIVSRDEFMQLFISVGLFTLASQLLWIVVTSLHVEVLNIPPFSIHGDVFLQLSPVDPRGRVSSPLNRFLVTIGIVSFVTLCLTTLFWYWKISHLSGLEARMTLLDTGWYENRRELNRQAKWIAWSNPRNRAVEKPKRRGRRITRLPRATTIAIAIGIVILFSIAMLFLLS